MHTNVKSSVSAENSAKTKKAKSYLYEFKTQLPLQSMVIPGVIFMVIFCYIPIYGLTIAFKNYTVVDSIGSARWVGLENFRIVMKDKYFWQSMVNTLGISMLKLLIGFPTPIILAIMINEIPYKGFKRVVQTISYLPHFLSWIVLGGMLTRWLSTTGMLNTLLLRLEIIDKPTNFLLDGHKYWMISALSDVWKEAGWGTVLYLAAMAGIDPTYYEAARIDGASKLRQIFSITLPMISRIISLNFILTVSGLLKSNLDQTMVLMNSQNQEYAEVIDSYVYRMGLSQGDFSYATAVGLGVSIVSVIILVIANRLTKRINDGASVF